MPQIWGIYIYIYIGQMNKIWEYCKANKRNKQNKVRTWSEFNTSNIRWRTNDIILLGSSNITRIIYTVILQRQKHVMYSRIIFQLQPLPIPCRLSAVGTCQFLRAVPVPSPSLEGCPWHVDSGRPESVPNGKPRARYGFKKKIQGWWTTA